jgi:hypothetical protein
MRVFISYRTNAEPDRSLCDALYAAFEHRRHSTFVDRRIQVGDNWAKEIEQALQQADFLVLLLSEESSHSEMVLGEVERARAIAANREGLPKILPVRVAYQGKLPYPLDCYIDPLQHVLWRGAADTASVIEDLERVIGGGTPSAPSAQNLSEAASQGLERPTAFARVSEPLNTPGGALAPDDALYASRASDGEALRVIERGPGQTITIKGPRQVGKSSLLMRLLAKAIDGGRHVALVDFQLLAAATGGESSLCQAFLREILAQLDLPPLGEKDWDESSTPAQACTLLLDRLVLKTLQAPLTLACDEADLVLALPFRDHFFGMLRSWHSKRAHPTLRKRWGQLDLVLVTSTEPYLFIERADQSPFNVGTVLALEDFDKPQLDTLNAAHGTPLAAAELGTLLELTGGHPYLVRRALYAVAARGQAMRWRDLLDSATDDTGPFGDHLRRHLLNVLSTQEIKPVFAAVLSGQAVPNAVAVHRLMGAGLVRRRGDSVIPRCGLYAKYFKGKV